MLSALYAIARPSVTRMDHQKPVEARITQFSPCVNLENVSSKNSKGFSRAGTSKKGGVGISHFLALSANNWKTVADTAKVTIND